MARRNSSIGFMGVFGRSSDLRQLDQALRSVDLHPKVVPEAVKLTACALLKDHTKTDSPPDDAYRRAAELIAYCMVGPEAFALTNDHDMLEAVERRIEAALQAARDSLDADLILLTLHAKVIQPSVIARFAIEAVDDQP